MKYISTRGQAPALNFEEVLLTGLASDGGLYVPETLPTFSEAEIAAMAGMNYAQLAQKIITPFVDDCIPEADLKAILEETYAEFRHEAVAPMVQIDSNQWVLELFHGPTLAFKDFALQLLGRLLDYVLERKHQKVVIMGATSGDTGSAAIEGCKRCKNIDIFILHPHERVSDVQRKQMTTVVGDNIHNLAVQGNFDDCQAMVKASFNDRSFLPSDRSLVAVNSINWARIMAQIVYYFYAAVALGAPARKVAFSVPTGNFGDIFAGYLAHKMGLPVERLIIATNRNDVLHRIMTSGSYGRQPLEHSLSPSMDITVSSNFERLLFDLYQRDGAAIAQLMSDFDNGDIHFSEDAMGAARELFSSQCVSDEETCAQMAATWDRCEYMLDPHSAIGVKAALEAGVPASVPVVTLATAHPAKFPGAVAEAGLGEEPTLPHHLRDLFDRPERCEVLPNELGSVQAFMADNLNA
ncbi:threonine synthase [Halioglobus japonicus]|uniref:Threonine synthase n=1 Tax=Halioglobus japonicus TaxID=930805 RepID=A0AAP8MHU6_9GAMM|nr:threonine synthase [Halioglobus japonicus]AQA20325.1 threonine synthase [Halioglobus japonicus]PLW88148.1 threonine synthase [Halioglobus japonicus]GHD07564.1 threonine synthase [Halioglobus japonicus]